MSNKPIEMFKIRRYYDFMQMTGAVNLSVERLE